MNEPRENWGTLAGVAFFAFLLAVVALLTVGAMYMTGAFLEPAAMRFALQSAFVAAVGFFFLACAFCIMAENS